MPQWLNIIAVINTLAPQEIAILAQIINLIHHQNAQVNPTLNVPLLPTQTLALTQPPITK